jgi:putative endonuclease
MNRPFRAVSRAAAPPERRYYVYILSTPSRGLFLGVTNDLARRLSERRLHGPPGADSLAEAARLVYFEVLTDFRRAIARKEQLEGWNRNRRWRLIGSVNPEWKDLSGEQ